MQIVNRSNARLLPEKITNLIGLDPGWHRIERHANGVTQQAPRACQNDHGDREAYERIEPRPAGITPPAATTPADTSAS
jgi:hypothetical protein